MNLSIHNNIAKYNQNLSSHQQEKSTWGILCHNCAGLLKSATTSSIENVS